MKNKLFLITTFTLFLIACGSNNSPESVSTPEDMDEIIKNMSGIDSAEHEIEQGVNEIKKEVDELSIEIDSLLNDI